jgi:cell division septum initiation protein DivIVA
MSMAFDTLKFAHRLEQVGVSREQAEAHAELARDMIIADLATKSDVALAVKDLNASMSLLEQRIVIKLGAMIAGAVAVVVGR